MSDKEIAGILSALDGLLADLQDNVDALAAILTSPATGPAPKEAPA